MLVYLFLILMFYLYFISIDLARRETKFINDEKSIRIEYLEDEIIKDLDTGFEKQTYYLKEIVLWQK